MSWPQWYVPLILPLERHRQAYLYEMKASLAYIVNSRSTTQSDPIFRKTKQNKTEWICLNSLSSIVIRSPRGPPVSTSIPCQNFNQNEYENLITELDNLPTQILVHSRTEFVRDQQRTCFPGQLTPREHIFMIFAFIRQIICYSSSGKK